LLQVVRRDQAPLAVYGLSDGVAQMQFARLHLSGAIGSSRGLASIHLPQLVLPPQID
jgi:hypothetical protein